MSGLDQSQYASMMPGAPAQKVSEAEKKEINDTLVACYNNLAACQIKLSNWPRVVASANQVLKLTPTNAKALYRRGMAYRELNELAKAESDLTKADELAPGDNGVKLELAKLKKRYAEYDKKQKKEWAGLFDRMAKNEEKE
ncbi:TPR-like protein [Rhizoclosmatium globosum]|uniref:peptidylprolyl isomerase n=1 Tax=Rhizoclosmatium globosum TaxID=329046 RepID=A0A1Y2CM56_9FUNG|nr:TPR-like protein [Rhizoclosmatium globosum]|eukprot:ORY47445.1 TPR-like protein [Rhizoclosmatium globosum]